MTGFRIEPAVGLVDARTFYEGLARRTFLATAYLRDPRTPFFTSDPDWVHEWIGHIAFLASERIARLYQLFGRAAMAASSTEEVTAISSIYWYSMEMGLVWEDGRWRAVGAAILSSVDEIRNIRNVEIRPFDPVVVSSLPSDDSRLQPVLFGAASFDAMLEAISTWLQRSVPAAA
jgi:phenylalanine-4-hydroxylase